MLRHLGRSPRVRGSHLQRDPRHARDGSIPACAGEPRRDRRVAPARRVDPRVCGGAASAQELDELTRGRSPRVRGSRGRSSTREDAGRSPRVRGSPPGPVARTVRCGSIPACAGEPSPDGRTNSPSGVDPRVCGGADRRPSPMRFHAEGSIPACAGEPHRNEGLSGGARVDPRVCGGAPVDACRGGTAGRSPRVRGSPPVPSPAPSDAGRSPRVRGSPEGRDDGGSAALGRSPRVRGSHHPMAGRTHLRGSIPACAGEPAVRLFVPARRACRVDPRVCGGAFEVPVRRCPGGSIPACAGEPRSRGPQSRSRPGRSPRVRGSRRAPRPGASPGRSPRVRGSPPRWWLSRPVAMGRSPRVRGSLGRVVKHRAGAGRSPRVRGSSCGRSPIPACARSPARSGSIPACAGEPSRRAVASPG
jgi:hypothetical protein